MGKHSFLGWVINIFHIVFHTKQKKATIQNVYKPEKCRKKSRKRIGIINKKSGKNITEKIAASRTRKTRGEWR